MPLSGPLFDGRATAALDDYTEWAHAEVGQQALADWQSNMDSAFQYPTGYYESTVRLDSDEYGTTAHDTGLIYNYWLEGIGRRNAPRTRFEGYHSASRAAEQAQQRIGELIQPIPAQFMAAMGGGR
jgi:hypothetical protein